MYTRNASQRAEPEEDFNRYRYAMPPKYGGSRFRRQSDRVIALPDSAFTAPEEPPAVPEETKTETPAPETPPETPDTAETEHLAYRLGDLLENVAKDDLLLAAVIVMLYAEKRESGEIDSELVLILAILLVMR